MKRYTILEDKILLKGLSIKFKILVKCLFFWIDNLLFSSAF